MNVVEEAELWRAEAEEAQSLAEEAQNKGRKLRDETMQVRGSLASLRNRAQTQEVEGRKKCERLRKLLEDLQSTLATLPEEISSQETEQDQLRAHNEGLEFEMVALQQRVDAAEEKVEHEEGIYSALTSDFQGLQRKVEQFEWERFQTAESIAKATESEQASLSRVIAETLSVNAERRVMCADNLSLSAEASLASASSMRLHLVEAKIAYCNQEIMQFDVDTVGALDAQQVARSAARELEESSTSLLTERLFGSSAGSPRMMAASNRSAAEELRACLAATRQGVRNLRQLHKELSSESVYM